jgi:uncharacterized protein with NRDE domain
VCLLIVASRLDDAAPLVVGANRDEQFDRPAVAVTVLLPGPPRVLGGRDLMAGGSWLAVNEHGVVAALTNGPSPEGRDPTKRSRGELPLALAGFDDATAAVEYFAHSYHPRDYNRAWLLVGDRRSLHYIDMTGDDEPVVRTLPAGLHILGNGPLDDRSVKIDHVRDVVTTAVAERGSRYVSAMKSALSDHAVPPGAAEEMKRRPVNRKDWPLELLAACVHIPSEKHGTRSSAVVSVPAGANARPSMWVADGPPCTTPYADATELWDRPVPD